jgi:hypothetical protein
MIASNAGVAFKQMLKPSSLIFYPIASFAGKSRAPIDLVKVKFDKKPELAPLMKKELKERFPEFDKAPTIEDSMLPG